MKNILCVFYRTVPLLVFAVFLTACNTVQLPEEYVSGNVVLAVDQDGTFTRQMQSNDAVKEFVFHSEKDRVEFFVGDPIRIRAENIDFGNYTFKTVVAKNQSGRNKVIMTLERVLENTIRLEEKCQTIFWNNPYYTPVIEISSSLQPEQIVLTPVFNGNCRRIGYEIRYGSTERGCEKQAKEKLEQFSRCVKRDDTPPPRKKNSTEPSRSLAEVVFGVRQ